MDHYVIDDYQYRTMMAMREFAENAFVGYPEGRGQKEEQELANTFAWLVRDAIDLFDASIETVEEFVEDRPYLLELLKKRVTIKELRS